MENNVNETQQGIPAETKSKKSLLIILGVLAIILIAVVGVVLLTSKSGSEDKGDVYAIVNGEKVYEKDFNTKLKQKEKIKGSDYTGDEKKFLLKDITSQIAKDQGFIKEEDVTEKEIDQRIKDYAKASNQSVDDYKKYSIEEVDSIFDEDGFRRSIKASIAQEKLVQRLNKEYTTPEEANRKLAEIVGQFSTNADIEIKVTFDNSTPEPGSK